MKVVAAIIETTPKRWPKELVAAGLWRLDEGGDGFWINDYLIYNPSAEAMRALSDKRRAAGVRGAEKRWRGVDVETIPVASAIGKSYGKGLVPAEQREEKDLLASLPGRQSEPEPLGSEADAIDRARTASERTESLPIEIEFQVGRLMRLVGDHADDGGHDHPPTIQVVRSLARQLPESSLGKVIESLETHQPNDRAAYAVGALRDELTERSNAA